MSKSSKSEAVDYFHLPRPLWRKLKKCLPERKRSKRGGRPARPDRAAMNALWYVLWTGCQWKALHRSWFGISASAVHARFQRWQQLGVFEKIMRCFAKYYSKKRKVKWQWQSLDSKSYLTPIDLLGAVLVERPDKPQHLSADAAYDSTDLQSFIVLEGYTPHIKTNKRRGREPEPRGLGEPHPSRKALSSSNGPSPGSPSVEASAHAGPRKLQTG